MTGLAAVGAALVVGLRQTAISQKQNEILDRQAKLSELQLRSQLFDRRFGCYENARQYVAQIVANAAPANRDSEFKYVSAMHESVFLFDAKVHQHLRDIWKVTSDFRAVHLMTRDSFAREGHYGPQLDREHELLQRIAEHLGNLIDGFGDEMRLSAGSTAATR